MTRRAKRICPKPGCPNIAQGRYCTQHNRDHEQARGTAHQRGYGTRHQRLRQQLAKLVSTGSVACARCGNLITSNDAWDLGHNDNDKSSYNGPEHANCNRSAAGKQSHKTL